MRKFSLANLHNMSTIYTEVRKKKYYILCFYLLTAGVCGITLV